LNDTFDSLFSYVTITRVAKTVQEAHVFSVFPYETGTVLTDITSKTNW